MSAENNGELLVKVAAVAGDYRIDDQDVRPWGHYIVTGVGRTPKGEEYCEKQIVIKPWNILSLQSHALRREQWTVGKGFLTALVDGERRNAGPEESVHVPQNSIHCMANLTDEICVVHERQEGICREDDIRRFVDAYGRATDAASGESAASIAAYNAILQEIKTKTKARMGRVAN